MSRGTWESRQEESSISSTGLSPSMAQLSSCVLLSKAFVTSRDGCSHPHEIPQPHSYNARMLTYEWFGLVPVRSPLLGESLLISFPAGTEMFQFPAFASLRMKNRFPDSEISG